MLNTNFLYYDTPAHQFQTYYPNQDQPFKHKISTQFPRNVALIRLVAIAIFGTLLTCTLPTTMGSIVAIAAVSYAGWTIYSHLIKKDPLVEAFLQILGGEDKYEDLPEITLTKDKTILQNIDDLKWDELKESVYRATTLDGRKILIVRALAHNQQRGISIFDQAKTIFAFVEKTNFSDISKSNSWLENSNILPTMCGFLLFINENPCEAGFHYSTSIGSANRIYGSIENNIANEFFAQLN